MRQFLIGLVLLLPNFIEAQNVGIGTTTPVTKLDIIGTSSGPSIPGSGSTGIFRIGTGALEGVDFGKLNSSPFSAWMQAGYNGITPDPLSLQPMGGNVGIGITSPAEKLDVTGNINVTGTIKVNGVDGTANQVLMKNGSGILTWGPPSFPPSVSDTSVTFLAQTLRNIWINDPNISVTVPESGKYLVAFFGSLFNNNETFGTETSYDSEGFVRVFNSTAATEVFSTSASALYFDLYTPNDSKRKYMSLRPAFSIMANLQANDILRLQYIQFAFGSPLPGSWIMGNGGIFILKIAN